MAFGLNTYIDDGTCQCDDREIGVLTYRKNNDSSTTYCAFCHKPINIGKQYRKEIEYK